MTHSQKPHLRITIAVLLVAAALALVPAAAGAAPCADCTGTSGDVGSGSGTGAPGGTAVTTVPALAPYRIDWPAFSHQSVSCTINGDQRLCAVDPIDSPLPDGDHVWLSEQADPAIPTTQVEVVLQSQVSWWKEIRAFTSAGQAVSAVSTQDARRGPFAMRLNVSTAKWLVLSKAKTWGIHTAMYQLGGLAQKGGMRLTFTWASD